MTTIFEIFKMIKRACEVGRVISSVAKKRKNSMAAVSMVWGSIFASGLQFNWGLRFVPKSVMESKEIGLEINAPDAIFATIPKLCCILVCLENLKEATSNMPNKEWACFVIKAMAHEYRHAQQIEYFESVGLDSNYVLKYIASKYSYTGSPVEQDAIQYSTNIEVRSEGGCPEIHSRWVEVSVAMRKIADEVYKAQEPK